jgi:hypothetical protein
MLTSFDDMHNAAAKIISLIFVKSAITDIGTTKHEMKCQYHHSTENTNLISSREDMSIVY